MLRDFDSAVEQFREAYLQLDSYLAKTACVRFSVRIRAGELASDILSFCPVFVEVHTQAMRDSTEQTRQLAAEWPMQKVEKLIGMTKQMPYYLRNEIPPEEFKKFLDEMPKLSWSFEKFQQHFKMTDDSFAKLRANYKGLFYIIRAYQDALYNVLLEITGERAGAFTSMYDAFCSDKRDFEAKNPVAEILKAFYPEYLEWFLDWREKRNLITSGVGCAFEGPSDDLGIAFRAFDTSAGSSADYAGAVRISDVIGALKASAGLASLALEQAIRRNAERLAAH